MPNKSKKSSRASVKSKPRQKNEPALVDSSPQRLLILRRLDESMKFLEKTLNEIPENLWTKKPALERWSIGEIVHHLILVEVQRLELIKALLAGKKESLPPRDGLAPDIATARTSPNKNQAPPEMQPKAGLPIKVLRTALRRARQETKTFVQTIDLQRAATIWLKTASLGIVNAAEYLEFLSAHMERHADQVLNLKESLSS
jgi:uncharacterized damage-inducible protein DinB